MEVIDFVVATMWQRNRNRAQEDSWAARRNAVRGVCVDGDSPPKPPALPSVDFSGVAAGWTWAAHAALHVYSSTLQRRMSRRWGHFLLRVLPVAERVPVAPRSAGTAMRRLVGFG
jgi:hypothetical protein